MMDMDVMQDCRTYQPRYDAVVIGARCAGASTALLLARSEPRRQLFDAQNLGSLGVKKMTTAASPWMKTIAGKPGSGVVARRTRTTRMQDVELFTEMTGDKNPIHYDEELAAASPFGGLIVQGGITTGLLNAVVAEDLPCT